MPDHAPSPQCWLPGPEGSRGQHRHGWAHLQPESGRRTLNTDRLLCGAGGLEPPCDAQGSGAGHCPLAGWGMPCPGVILTLWLPSGPVVAAACLPSLMNWATGRGDSEQQELHAQGQLLPPPNCSSCPWRLTAGAGDSGRPCWGALSILGSAKSQRDLAWHATSLPMVKAVPTRDVVGLGMDVASCCLLS